MTAAAASAAATSTSGLSRNLIKGLDCQTAQTSSGWLQVAKKLVKMAQNEMRLFLSFIFFLLDCYQHAINLGPKIALVSKNCKN